MGFMVGLLIACVIVAVPALRYAALVLAGGAVVLFWVVLHLQPSPPPQPPEPPMSREQVAAYCAGIDPFSRAMCAAIHASR